jgi:hypothetical protein
MDDLHGHDVRDIEVEDDERGDSRFEIRAKPVRVHDHANLETQPLRHEANALDYLRVLGHQQQPGQHGE